MSAMPRGGGAGGGRRAAGGGVDGGVGAAGPSAAEAVRSTHASSALIAVVSAGLVLAACSSSGTATDTGAGTTTAGADRDTAADAPASSTPTSGTTTSDRGRRAPRPPRTAPSNAQPSSTSTGGGSTTTTAPSLVPPRSGDPALYPPLPPQPDGVPFPTEDWLTGELPDGVPVAAIDAAVATAFGADDSAARVRSLLVVQGGRLVYERYHPLDDADTATASWSVAKSFASAAIGMLAGDGRLDPLAPAPIPEWSDPADPRSEITVADLLHMSSGLEWTESFDPNGESDVLTMLQIEDAAVQQIDKPLEADPGTLFNYSTGTSAVLSRILSDTVGGDQEAMDFVTARLLEPIGITSLQFRTDPGGRWYGGIGADATPTRLRPLRTALPARRRVGRRADPAGGLGRLHPHSLGRAVQLRRPLVAVRPTPVVLGPRALRAAGHRRAAARPRDGDDEHPGRRSPSAHQHRVRTVRRRRCVTRRAPVR